MSISKKYERPVEIVEPTAPAALVKQASKAAAKGMVNYAKYWKNIGPESRQLLSKINGRIKNIAMQHDDDTDITLTEEQRQSRQAFRSKKVAADEESLRQTEKLIEERKNDPEIVKTKEWIEKVYKGDVDAICEFAARVIAEHRLTIKENQESVERLNSVLWHASYFSPNMEMDSSMRQVFAEMFLQHQPDDPASLAFRMGANVSKQSQGRRGAAKRVQNRWPVKVLAIKLFEARAWKSTKQASKEIWPQVAEEAKLAGWTMSEENGPETIYKWLLAHQKEQRLQAGA